MVIALLVVAAWCNCLTCYPTGGRPTDGMFLVANPSIGPGSIGENSLGAGYGLSASGVQMDRVGLPADDQSDTKSASMKNMTGSLYEPDSALHQR